MSELCQQNMYSTTSDLDVILAVVLRVQEDEVGRGSGESKRTEHGATETAHPNQHVSTGLLQVLHASSVLAEIAKAKNK